MTEEIWHRFEDFRTAPPLNERDEPCGGPGLHLRHRTFEVTKTTKRGVWLREIIPPFEGETRFVLAGARRRFACPTEGEALASFRARKRRQIGIHQANVRLAQRALELAPVTTRWTVVGKVGQLYLPSVWSARK